MDQIDFLPAFKWGRETQVLLRPLTVRRDEAEVKVVSSSGLLMPSGQSVASQQIAPLSLSLAGKAAADVLVIEKLRIWLRLRTVYDAYSFSPVVV